MVERPQRQVENPDVLTPHDYISDVANKGSFYGGGKYYNFRKITDESGQLTSLTVKVGFDHTSVRHIYYIDQRGVNRIVVIDRDTNRIINEEKPPENSPEETISKWQDAKTKALKEDILYSKGRFGLHS